MREDAEVRESLALGGGQVRMAGGWRWGAGRDVRPGICRKLQGSPGWREALLSFRGFQAGDSKRGALPAPTASSLPLCFSVWWG